MAAPTPSTDKVLEFIKARVRDGGDFPSPRAIARHMGWHGASGARDALTRLRRRGDIRLKGRTQVGTKGWHSEWELAEDSTIRGRAAAGEEAVLRAVNHHPTAFNPIPVKEDA